MMQKWMILDGNSEINTHIRSNFCYLICLRRLIRSRAVTNLFFFSARPYFPWCVRKMFWVTIKYKCHASPIRVEKTCIQVPLYNKIFLLCVCAQWLGSWWTWPGSQENTGTGSDLTKIDLDPTHEKKSWIRTLTNYIHHKIHTQLFFFY